MCDGSWMLTLFTLLSTRVLSAVFVSAATEDTWPLAAIARHRSMKSRLATRLLNYRTIQSTRTATCISEVYASVLTGCISQRVQRTSRLELVFKCLLLRSKLLLILCPKVWDIQSRTIKFTFAGHEQDIYSLDFAMNGRHIASGSGDHSVRVWDIEYNREILNLMIEDGVTTVAISPSGDYVAAGSLDKSVRVWDVRSGTLIARLDGMDGHKDSVYSVAFGPDSETLVSGSLDKTIKMWQLSPDNRGGMMGGGMSRGGRLVRTFEGHKVSDGLHSRK